MKLLQAVLVLISIDMGVTCLSGSGVEKVFENSSTALMN